MSTAINVVRGRALRIRRVRVVNVDCSESIIGQVRAGLSEEAGGIGS